MAAVPLLSVLDTILGHECGKAKRQDKIVLTQKAWTAQDEEAWLNDMVNAGFTKEQALLILKRPG